MTAASKHCYQHFTRPVKYKYCRIAFCLLRASTLPRGPCADRVGLEGLLGLFWHMRLSTGKQNKSALVPPIRIPPDFWFSANNLPLLLSPEHCNVVCGLMQMCCNSWLQGYFLFAASSPATYPTVRWTLLDLDFPWKLYVYEFESPNYIIYEYFDWLKGYSQCITMDVDFSGASNTACPLHFYLVGIGRDGPGLGFNPPAYLNNVKTFRCCRSTRHNSTVAHTHTLTISFPNDQYMIGPKAVIYLSRFFAVFFIKELTKSPLKLLPKALPCSPVKPLPKARPCNPPKFYPLHPLKALPCSPVKPLPNRTPSWRHPTGAQGNLQKPGKGNLEKMHRLRRISLS